MPALRWLLVGASLVLTGCLAGNVRASVGPTVDTLGQWGVEARVGAGFGIGSNGGVTLDGHFGVGHQGQPEEGATVGGGGGLALVARFDRLLGLRAALLGAGRGADGVDLTRRLSGSVGVEGGALIHLGAGLHLDLGLRIELVISSAETRGILALPIGLELFGTTDPGPFGQLRL